jgi:hypothetical protein
MQSEESQDSLKNGKQSKKETGHQSNKVKEEDIKATQVSLVISENVGILILAWL